MRHLFIFYIVITSAYKYFWSSLHAFHIKIKVEVVRDGRNINLVYVIKFYYYLKILICNLLFKDSQYNKTF